MSNSQPPILMKVKRKKTSSSGRTNSQLSPYSKPKHSTTQPTTQYDPGISRGILNPFSVNRKQGTNLLEIKENTSTEDNSLFNILSKPAPNIKLFSSQDENDSYLSYLDDNNAAKKDKGETSQRHTLPRDWSLKTSVNFLSKTCFKWTSRTQLKPAEEAKLTELLCQQNITDTEDKLKVHKYLSYWSFPNIPWLRLFPRNRPSASKINGTVLKQDALHSLSSQWETAFESLFGLLKNNRCPYFYLCSHLQTVFFRKLGDILEADVVPTTCGIRDSLALEGIEFTMPLFENSDENKDIENVAKEAGDMAEDAKNFLESIGVNSGSYQNLNPETVRTSELNKINLDHNFRSLVRVKGSHVLGLFNYLLNDKSLVPTVGELCGIPPTLIAPIMFIGSSASVSKMKCGSSLARQPNGLMEEIHYLQITGPILPQNLHNLLQTLKKAQGQYSATMDTLAHTSAFNAPTDAKQNDLPLYFTIQQLKHSNNNTWICR